MKITQQQPKMQPKNVTKQGQPINTRSTVMVPTPPKNVTLIGKK
jgi:hypothetical protein